MFIPPTHVSLSTLPLSFQMMLTMHPESVVSTARCPIRHTIHHRLLLPPPPPRPPPPPPSPPYNPPRKTSRALSLTPHPWPSVLMGSSTSWAWQRTRPSLTASPMSTLIWAAVLIEIINNSGGSGYLHTNGISQGILMKVLLWIWFWFTHTQVCEGRCNTKALQRSFIAMTMLFWILR